MKQLKENYKKNGYSHRLLWRDELYAITEVSDGKTKKVYCYEAFKIKKHRGRSTDLITVEPFESSPDNESWGMLGYTAVSFEDAKLKINKLKQKSKTNGKEN